MSGGRLLVWKAGLACRQSHRAAWLQQVTVNTTSYDSNATPTKTLSLIDVNHCAAVFHGSHGSAGSSCDHSGGMVRPCTDAQMHRYCRSSLPLFKVKII